MKYFAMFHCRYVFVNAYDITLYYNKHIQNNILLVSKQQQQKHNQQQQFLQLNQRRSMEDVLKKLASAGREGVDQKVDKMYDYENSRYFADSCF